MDFFGYQQQARRKSFLLILGVVLAAVLMILAINFLVLVFLGWQYAGPLVANGNNPSLSVLLSREFLSLHSNVLLTISAAVSGLMAVSSAGKVMSLRGGGGQVARQLGGDLITTGHNDPLRRRLYNVVEEISIASGVPVPEVYVLEEEAGINAFAAGYTQSDAAVAVTRGALETFDRAELQGVIAHEFSHILNGDTRINIRLMGIVFGILVLSIIGRRLLVGTRHSRSRSSSIKGVSITIVVGLGLMIIGYAGLFFARWLKASVSRQREYLADASAVQFTRDPEGISSALKKIAVHSNKSYLRTDSEEVSHMLFGDGERPNYFSSKLFATHPPLLDRIQRIEPRFKEQHLAEFAKRLYSKEKHEQAKQAEKEAKEQQKSKQRSGFDVNGMLEDIGHPSLEQILLASALADSMPSAIEQSAHSPEWAPEVVLLAILSADKKIRERQLDIIANEMGHWSDQKMDHLLNHAQALTVEHRLPLLEMAFPQIKHRPISELETLLSTIRKMVTMDKQVDTFEYLLFKQLEIQIQDKTRPDKAVLHGKKLLNNKKAECVDLMSILAIHGSDNTNEAKKAFNKGVVSLELPESQLLLEKNWSEKLDEALKELNTLRPQEKKKLVIALANIILNDGKVTIQEHELLRAICASLHIPLPVLA